MSLDYRIEIQCNECGKDITTMRDSETYCWHCHEALKDKISELEEKLEKAQDKINELEE